MSEITPQLSSFLNDHFKKLALPKFDLNSFLFKEQLALVNDPAKFATAVCSVRAGKTISCAADLINTALTKPGTVGLYITLARSSAKRIIWPELHKINRDFKLGAIPNESDLSFKFPNNSIIYCSGASDSAEIEKFRGLSNVALGYLDESQAFRAHIKELVEEILIKRLYDTNGRLRLIGTPGPIPAGYFYEASQSSSWSHHAWTLHNNPWIQRKSGCSVVELIQQDCDRKGVTIDDPSIQRECFGRWVLDSTSLLLQYKPEINDYDEIPRGAWNYILGMDFGYDDADSFTVLAFSDHSPNTYLVEEVINSNHTFDQMAHEVDKLFKKYNFCRVVADPGGGGKKLVESLKQRYPIPMIAADKQGKIANYGLLNNALRSGRFFAKRNSRFAQDCNLLERDRDRSTPDKTIVKGHSDAVDSCFIAGTLIECERGLIPIELVNLNDRVLTRDGYKNVVASFSFGFKEVVQYEFSNGTKITCTDDHPFYTQRGFVNAGSLLYADSCVSLSTWQKEKKSSLTDINSGDIQTQKDHTSESILKENQDIKENFYIDMCTNALSEKLKRAFKFTTKTETLLTMNSVILNAFPQKSTTEYTKKKGLKLNAFALSAIKNIFQTKQAKRQYSTALEHAGLNIGECQEKTTHHSIASYVEKSLWRQGLNQECIAVTLVRRKIKTQKEVVYNLTIASSPEYFANGILVHNCLYAFRESPAYSYTPPLPKPAAGTAEADKEFAQALFEHNMQKIERERKAKEGDEFGQWNVDQNMAPSWNQWND